MAQTETAILVTAAKEGDAAALESLFARHRGRLVAMLHARIRTNVALAVTADDLAQETLLEASRKIGAFESDGPASFYRWLVAIARFKHAESVRAAKAAKRALEVPLVEPPPARQTSPSAGALRGERAAFLHGALAELPEAQAEAVTLRWLEGLTVAETAGKLERSEAAVKALLARGLIALAQELQRRGISARPSGAATP